MKNEYVYNFTSNSGLILKDIFCSIEDKVVISFFYYSELEEKIIEEKNHLAWFIYEDITCRIALHFNLV